MHDAKARPGSKPATLGALRSSGWRSRSVREEMRDNLVTQLVAGRAIGARWPGILGYERTVLPQIENAILSRHDFILLGLRGQAKTRLLRMLVRFLDPEMPALEGCDLAEDPFHPITGRGRRIVEEQGDRATIRWVPRDERYKEKLATPDVTIADLIGDVDPIKAASRRVSLDDEDAIHLGLVPRSHRGLLAINELPDLSPRIQVGLLNVLEERDVQLRGFPVRLPIDVVLVFSANPEDYTNRGAIITPLRDRIASQIHTHYPTSLAVARAITDQEAYVQRAGGAVVRVPELVREVVEETAFQARRSEFVDQASGVSVRLPIALLENVVSNAERRALAAGRAATSVRIADLYAAESAVAGKVELVFEGEREGASAVAERLIGQASAAVFHRHFPAPYGKPAGGKRKEERAEPEDAYKPIVDWFAAGKSVVVQDESDGDPAVLDVPHLPGLVRRSLPKLDEADVAVACELVLEGLHQASLLSKERSADGVTYGDMLKRMFAGFED